MFGWAFLRIQTHSTKESDSPNVWEYHTHPIHRFGKTISHRESFVPDERENHFALGSTCCRARGKGKQRTKVWTSQIHFLFSFFFSLILCIVWLFVIYCSHLQIIASANLHAVQLLLLKLKVENRVIFDVRTGNLSRIILDASSSKHLYFPS